MTAIDTNVVIAPWDKRQSQYTAARAALEEALDLGPLIVSAPVYAELLAWPSQTEALVRSFRQNRNSGRVDSFGKSLAHGWKGLSCALDSAPRKRWRRGAANPGRHCDWRPCAVAQDGDFYRLNFPALRVNGFR